MHSVYCCRGEVRVRVPHGAARHAAKQIICLNMHHHAHLLFFWYTPYPVGSMNFLFLHIPAPFCSAK